jgi:hypothetical protein
MRSQTKNTYQPITLPITLCQSCCRQEQDWFDVCNQYQQEAVERNGRYFVLRCSGYTPAHEIDRTLSPSA